MEQYLNVVNRCALFAGIENEDKKMLLGCISAVRRQYQKEEFIFIAGDPPSSVGVVLAGSVQVLQEDYWGNRSILAQVEPGDLFGEAFSCAEIAELPISVVAAKQTEVLQIDYNKIASTCSSACRFHGTMIRNMMQILARKNIMLTQKIRHVTSKTTREKLLSYLSEQAMHQKSESFQIPFDRQQLADYLAVERSAMSKELCKMRDEGLLTFKKNWFRLQQRDV